MPAEFDEELTLPEYKIPAFLPLACTIPQYRALPSER